jgi:dihydroorotate dehydrogenase
MYSSLRPLAFRIEPERAHALTLNLMRLVGTITPLRWLLSLWFKPPYRPVEAFGLKFINPVGLAAGYDKDGIAVSGLACLGFGHIEVGTVTPKAQPGNERPRLFRLVEDEALINRMGFPGRGAEFVANQLQRARLNDVILGINIGKNKDTPIEEAAQDYLMVMRALYPFADYFAINVSSPNTVGLRQLQARQALEALLAVLLEERRALSTRFGRKTPLLVKLAPDLNEAELEDALGVLLDAHLDGVIATNTTLEREGLRSRNARESGGLSGTPLRSRSTAMIRRISQFTGGKLPIIGVGGIMSPQDAREKLEAGATLIQIYTGLVYRGPSLVREIVQAL